MFALLSPRVVDACRPRIEVTNPLLVAIVMSVGLFAGMLAFLEIGYCLSRRSSQRHPEVTHEGIGVVEAAVFALLGLLLGFSFADGTSRLEARRQLIVQETNAINTAYDRLDLLPASDQPAMRRLFRDYLDARLRVYSKLPDLKAADEELRQVGEMQQEIWSRAIASNRDDSTQNVARLLLPAINDMIDVTTGRTLALHTHLPLLIFFLLVFVAILGALLAGYAMQQRKKRSMFHMVLYAAAIAITLYAILDLDYPRSGLIKIDTADQLLLHLRDSIRSSQY
jgi:phosphotransferase system  glucose/maltose/N-acetylglucosamine-specific IIC component